MIDREGYKAAMADIATLASYEPDRRKAEVLDRALKALGAVWESLEEPEYEYGYAPLATSREKFPTEEEAKKAYWMYLGPIRKFRRRKPVLNKWEEVK